MKNAFLLAQFEVTRLLLTRRGLISVLAFALVWFVILRYAIYPASRFVAGNTDNVLLRMVLDQINLNELADWLVPELSVYWVFALYLLPLFCITLTADQTATDRTRGTLRFLHLRATRSQIFLGRFLGQMLVQALFIGVTVLTTFGLALYRDQTLAAAGLEHMLVIIVNLLIVLLPYTALMALMSVFAKSARQAVMFAIILWIATALALRAVAQYFPDLTMLELVLPGSQVSSLLTLRTWETLEFSIIPLVQTAVLLLLGWFAFRRVDL